MHNVMTVTSALCACAGVGLGAYQWLYLGDAGAGLACFAGMMFISAFVAPGGGGLR